ncbi:hypothetical protein CI109_104181 [Kwoniella shandongensis]|uniref:Uncharacterized protein n=1 Tax=Kwoniella shandongensis TaxID=1734106 RepID=A0A5M6C6F0_9TREE|nr:uncharacterized protein CI109_002907 [Kwoniella shandongensis]KAA5528749.1 hypothetical protein CI109_002907 [Kwoniella shandongensis]
MSSPSSSAAGPSHHAAQRGSIAKKPLNKMEKFTFTLGKLDAGMAILLGPNAHLLEFPSLLLPTPSPGTPPLGPGSILTITVSRDVSAELAAQEQFRTLQQSILETYTVQPKIPIMKIRNVTQTSVCVEWDRIDVGSAGFRGLEMYRNGQRWGRVGGDFGLGRREKREWKTGGLQSGEEYTFQLILKTTAGTYPSNLIRVRTHTMDNLTGLLIHFGPIEPPALLDQLRGCLREIGARESETVALDTTHFVCTSPIVGGDDSGRGGSVDRGYQEALKSNLPIVGPGWLLAVAGDRKLVPISNYSLPALPANTGASSDPAPFRRPEPLKRSSLPFTSSAPPSPNRENPEEIRRSPSPETIARMSMTGGGSGHNGPSGPRNGSIERRRSREMSLEVETRPRSPKPEADGKLDRGFKFPLSNSASNSPSGSPTKSAEPKPVPVRSSPSSGSIPEVSEPSSSRPAVTTPPFVETGISPKSPAPAKIEAPLHPVSEPEPEAEPVSVSAPEVVVTEEPAEIVETANVGSTGPPPIVTESAPAPAADPAESPKASTIDEAVANFHSAVAETPARVASPPAPATVPAPAQQPEVPSIEEGPSAISEPKPADEPVIGASEEPTIQRVEDTAIPATAVPTKLELDNEGESTATTPEPTEVITTTTSETVSKSKKKKNKKKAKSQANSGAQTPVEVEESTPVVGQEDAGAMDEIDLN